MIRFKTKDYNIEFGLFYKAPSSKEVEEVLPIQKLESQTIVQDRHVALKKGTYILRWNNSYSLMRSKELSFTLLTETPIEMERDTKNDTPKPERVKKSKKEHH